jgi:hypothetical protein
MASSLWKIRYDGVTRTAAEWGATNLVRTLRNLEVDELTFRVPRTDIFEACPFAYGNSLELFRGTVRFFIGTVQPPAATATGGGEGESWFITVANPWWKLQRIVYQQRRVLQNEDFSGLIGRYSPQVVLGQDEWGRKRATDYVIGDVANYALQHASGAFVVSAIGEGVSPPLTDARNVTCAAAIRRQLEWTPDAAAWFNYATEPTPSLVIQRRGDMDTLSIDLDDHDLRGLSSLRRRDDMVPAGVVFTFSTLEENAIDGKFYPRLTDQIAGASSGEAVVFAQFTLANQGTDQAEEIPAGLADAYYASLLTPYWEGALQHVDLSGECTGFARPGQLLNLLNGNPAWETMAAVVNTVTEDIDRGVTTIALGLPPTLGADDFRDLMAKARDTRPASDDSAKNHNGTDGVAAEDGGSGPAPALPGDPADESGKVPVDDRDSNANGGSSSTPLGAGNSTFTADFCIGGQVKPKTVIGA